VLSVYLSQLGFSKAWGLEYVLWAVLLGLIVRNTIGVPERLRRAFKAELYIKIGLVLLGAKILFGDLLVFGVKGMAQALAVVLTVFMTAYYISKKLGLDKKFSHVLAAGVSICGVSAAVAATGAVKGDKKELTYVISMVVALAVPMLILMPIVGRLISLPPTVAGAWIGGTIDTTPAVVASGALYGGDALKVASVVKLSQNVLIGLAAFLLAVYYALKVEKKSEERPSPLEIWYRFPKFVLGFLIVSLLASLALFTQSQLAIMGTIQNWFFAFTFVCIGLGTSFNEFKKLGGKPFVAFILAQAFNIVFTLTLAWLLFSVIP
jgi:uncharacterized integral membrane protein (TIGR00698 family)